MTKKKISNFRLILGILENQRNDRKNVTVIVGGAVSLSARRQRNEEKFGNHK
jgi:hypothetical protein